MPGICQDGFVKAWKSIDAFAGIFIFTWLIDRDECGRSIGFAKTSQRRRTEFDEMFNYANRSGLETFPRSSRCPPAMERANAGKDRSGDCATFAEHRAVNFNKETEDHALSRDRGALGCSIGTVMSRLFLCAQKTADTYEDCL